MSERADVVVLGMGPGGEYAAGKLAEAGLRVVGVDQRLVGGECPYWGCVPSKMMLRAAGLLAEARRVRAMAGRAEVEPDWGIVARRIRVEATDYWDDKAAVERFEAKGGTFVRGHGRFESPGTVVVGDRDIEAGKVLLNTGTEPWAPPVPGLADLGYWTNREAIETEAVPESLLVLGGGAIGVELSQVFARFGSAVTVVEMAPRIIPPEEPEASVVLTEALEEEGTKFRTGVAVNAARHDSDGFALELGDQWTEPHEKLLVATGRRADLASLGLESIGLELKEGARAIDVDDHLRVDGVEDVWAIGDVTGVGAFTHVSMYQARIAVADMLGEEVAPADYHALPRVTFTEPEVGSVGLTEAQASDRGIAVRVGRSEVPSSARGWIHKEGNAGLVKLVEDAERRFLVGATSAGPVGGEVLGLLQLAVQCRVPTPELSRLIFAYPTFTRAIADALDDLTSR